MCVSWRVILLTGTMCFFAWQLIRFVTSWDIIGFLSVSNSSPVFSPLTSPFAAGCLALWRGVQAAPRRTCVTCLQRWTPSSQLWPSSTLSTKSCWDHSYADERVGELKKNSGLLGIWGEDVNTIFNEVCVCDYICACICTTVLGCMTVIMTESLLCKAKYCLYVCL